MANLSSTASAKLNHSPCRDKLSTQRGRQENVSAGHLMKEGFIVYQSHLNGQVVGQFRDFWFSLIDKLIKLAPISEMNCLFVILKQIKITRKETQVQ